MNPELEELFNKLSDDTRNLLLVQNPSGSYKIRDNNFQNALESAKSIDEEKIVIEIFLRRLLETNAKWKNITWDKIEPYKDILIRICSELGLKELQNPFLVFLPEYYSRAKKDLTRDNVIDLNNLYAQDFIDRADLMGKGPSKFDHIIFNSNLYANENVDKMVEYWDWLNNADNLERMNWQEVLDANLTPKINEVANELVSLLAIPNSTIKSVDSYLERLYFLRGSKRGKTNTQETLEDLFAAGSIGDKQDNGKQLSTLKNLKGPKSADDLKNMLVAFANKNGLSETELAELFKAVIDEL